MYAESKGYREIVELLLSKQKTFSNSASTNTVKDVPKVIVQNQLEGVRKNEDKDESITVPAPQINTKNARDIITMHQIESGTRYVRLEEESGKEKNLCDNCCTVL